MICSLGTVNGRISDLTTGGTEPPPGRTGVLAHNAADVSWVTNRALEKASDDGPEDVRKTFFSFDLRPGTKLAYYVRSVSHLYFYTFIIIKYK